MLKPWTFRSRASRTRTASRGSFSIADGLRDDKWNDIHDYYDYRGRPLRVLYTPCGPDAFYFCLMAPITDVEGDVCSDCQRALDLEISGSGADIAAGWQCRPPRPLRNDNALDLVERTRGDRGRCSTCNASSLGQGAGVSIVNAGGTRGDRSASHRYRCRAWHLGSSNAPMVEAWQRRVEDVASQRSLGRAVRPSEQRLVELSSEDSDRKHARQEGPNA